MTEEEKIAEDYFCDGCENSFEHENGRCSNCTKWQFFIAGLKASRPQWHDLRENPNDLPTENCEVVTLHENGNKNIIKWKNGDWTNAIIIPVIKWYKIPKYTKE